MGHWYAKDGTPMHKVPKKDGTLKDTTLREAKLLNLIPSVTTVISIMNKPELDNWKKKTSILSALTLPRNDNETLDSFADRVISDADSISENAMDLGTIIHNAIETTILGGEFRLEEIDEKHHEIINFACMYILNGCFNGNSEQTIACDRYAGTIDFSGVCNCIPYECIVDFKTQSTKPDNKIRFYDDWKIQLAAYKYLISDTNKICANIVISTTEPGRIEVKSYENEEIRDAFDTFVFLLGAFYSSKKLAKISIKELEKMLTYFSTCV
jgi:hypothetical protein